VLNPIRRESQIPNPQSLQRPVGNRVVDNRLGDGLGGAGAPPAARPSADLQGPRPSSGPCRRSACPARFFGMSARVPFRLSFGKDEVLDARAAVRREDLLLHARRSAGTLPRRVISPVIATSFSGSGLRDNADTSAVAERDACRGARPRDGAFRHVDVDRRSALVEVLLDAELFRHSSGP